MDIQTIRCKLNAIWVGGEHFVDDILTGSNDERKNAINIITDYYDTVAKYSHSKEDKQYWQSVKEDILDTLTGGNTLENFAEDLSKEECLNTLISFLDTPVMRRKMSKDLVDCLDRYLKLSE